MYTILYLFIFHLRKRQSADFDHCYLFRKLSLSVFSESLLCMCDTLVVLTDPTFRSLAQVLPELLSGYNQRVCKSLILLQSLREQLHGSNYSFRRCLKMSHYILFMHCSKSFRQLCHASYLAHFTWLCIIVVGSLWQELSHMVLVSALTVFLLDLSFQQFTWVLKGDNNALDVLPKSTLPVEWNKMQNKKAIYIFEGKSLPWWTVITPLSVLEQVQI